MMSQIGCPECARPVEVTATTDSDSDLLSCPHCERSFVIEEGIQPGGETAVLQREKPKRGAMLDIALVGHLRVSGSLSLEAPSALRQGKTVVGRENCDILVADNTLSARHFEVENREGRFSIRDLSSTNGTKVNGHLLNQTVELRSGDRIEAGQTIFVFRTLETVPWTQPHHQGADHDQTT